MCKDKACRHCSHSSENKRPLCVNFYKNEMLCFLQIIKLLKSCVSIDPSVNYVSFETPEYDLIPSIVTDIVCNSRRDSGYFLLCVRHVTDTQCAPKRLSDIKLIKINHDNNNDYLCLEWSSDVSDSFKDQCYRSKLIITYNVELISFDCNCKASGKN